MSHWATVDTKITDMSALAKACEELGVELVEKGSCRGYYTPIQTAPFVIKLKGPYDVAVTPRDNGTCELTTDWWRGHVAGEVGENFSKLLQLYGVHKSMALARARGLRATRFAKLDGRIVVKIQGIT